MNGYLLDTNVISAGAPARQPSPDLVGWMEKNSGRLYLSTVTIAEIEIGIAKARRKKATRKAIQLTRWLELLLHLYAGRVLSFDIKAARVAGVLADLSRAKGHEPDFPDVAIAAIARARGLTVLTQNLKHFRPFGIPSHDPFASLPN